ncbi:MAG: VOC family protein [Mycolicibacterium sp.]|nr:VOC family protein [Mycolicibacterium sp.]
MPVRQEQAGTPCWIDLMSSDAERARAFYTDLFGWTADASEDPQYGGYTVLSKGDAMVAGLGQAPDGAPLANVWTTYLQADDIDTATTSAVAAGGQVTMPVMKVGDRGSMAVLTDAADAAIGLWQPDQHRGFGRVGEAGPPVWHALMSRHYEAALAFYAHVFGWTLTSLEDSSDFRYSTASLGGEPFAGIVDAAAVLPQGVPSFWQFYIGVDDVDAAVAKVNALGGSLLRESQDMPNGRMAGVADPLGAAFELNTLRKEEPF